MRIEDIFAIALLPTLLLILIIYVLISERRKKKKRLNEDPLTKKIRELEKEYNRITEDD